MKIKKWINWSISHPRWTVNLFKMGIKKKIDFRDHNKYSKKCYKFHQVEDILHESFNLDPMQIIELIAQYKPIQRSQGGSDKFIRWGASPELCLISYCFCRMLKPNIVVETGTAKGFLSTAILQALSENNQGVLISLELPPFGTSDFSYVGSAIPMELRSRWELQLGPSVPSLRKLIRENRSPDIFIHDSDHSYWNQLAEYRIALPALPEGGVLISDDIGNDAFYMAAQSLKKIPTLIVQSNKKLPLGLIKKK